MTIDHDAVFDTVAGDRGHRITLELMDGLLRVIEELGAASDLEVHAYFIENTKLQAFCFHRDGVGYVGISDGLLQVVGRVFSHALSCKEILREVGTSSVETGKPFGQPTMDFFDNVYQCSGNTVRPTDKIRSEFATRMSHIAAQFVVYHELSHLLHGHAQLLHDSGIVLLDDAPGAIPDKITSPVSRLVLEMDADTAATRWAVDTLLDKAAAEFASLSTDEIHRRIGNIAFEWAFAVGLMFHIFYGNGASLDDFVETESHPPAHLRQILTLNVAEQALLLWIKRAKIPRFDSAATVSGLMTKFKDGVIAAGDAFAHLSDCSPALSKVIERAVSHAERLQPFFNQEWRKLHPKLLPFAKVRLLVPTGSEN